MQPTNPLNIYFSPQTTMAEEKFLMLKLDDPQSKELAQVLASPSARTILSILAEKALSETDIAQRLHVPLSTVHYNIKQLLKANIIEIKDFLWSEKGKKIQLYQLANKLIIIAPKTTSSSYLEKLRDVVPVIIGGACISLGLYLYQLLTPRTLLMARAPTQEITRTASDQFAASSASETTAFMSASTSMPYALWLFIGVVIAAFLFSFFSWWRTRR